MLSEFDLPVTINDQELSLPARILRTGWQRKIEVETAAGLLHFERDEEGSWRVLSVEPGSDKIPSKELITAVITALSYLFDE